MNGVEVTVDFSLMTARSVLFDAVFVTGGMDSVTSLSGDGAAVRFVLEAYKHCKAIAVAADGVELLRRSGYAGFSELNVSAKSVAPEEGLILGSELDLAAAGKLLVAAMVKHRAWSREAKSKMVPV
jgi:catalase